MGMIIIIYLALCICVCFFKKLSLLLLGAGFIYDWYACFIAHQYGRAVLVLFLLCLMVTLYRVALGEDLSESQKQEKRSHAKHTESRFSGNWVLWLIPIFWPFLLVRLFLSDKTMKTDMSPYDYEQHLKSNAR